MIDKRLEEFAWNIVKHNKCKWLRIGNYKPSLVGYGENHLSIDFFENYNLPKKQKKGGYYSIKIEFINKPEEK